MKGKPYAGEDQTRVVVDEMMCLVYCCGAGGVVSANPPLTKQSKDLDRMAKAHISDWIGQRFGRWTVINLARIDEHYKKYFHTRCDCGQNGIVASDQLVRGRSRSCGCLHDEEMSARQFKHGQSARNRTGYYNIWNSMLQRCYNPKATKFKIYGGAGVGVTEPWHDFQTFFTGIIALIGERPKGTSLDRYPDPAGNYEPGNVRWATPQQQRDNTRPAQAAKHN